MQKGKEPTFTESLIGLIVIIVLLVGCVHIIDSDTSSRSTNTSPQKVNTQQTQQERQKRLNTINNLINEAHKGGLIIRIDRFNTNGRKCAYMIVNEYIWNQLPYETKQGMCRMVNEYNDLTGETILAFRGYRTGKDIMPFEFSVHDF